MSADLGALNQRPRMDFAIPVSAVRTKGEAKGARRGDVEA
jgi:hypothetical protein